MFVECCPVETVLELPVRVYPAEVYIPEVPEPSIALIVQRAKNNQGQRRILGIVIPHHPTEQTFARY